MPAAAAADASPTRLHWLPVLIFLWLPFSFLTTYILAVQQGHVYPLFPAISDTGTLPPESCVFSLLVNILALLLTFAVWLRARQMKELSSEVQGTAPGRITNKISSFFGYCACFGLYVVANCQETNTLLLHFIGALLAFWCSCFYSFMQTLFSYWLIDKMNTSLMFAIRLVLCCVQLLLNFLSFYAFFVALSLFHRDSGVGRTLQWSPEDPGWKWHLVAAVSEWLLAITIGFFVLTFYPDFRSIALKLPTVKLILKHHDGKQMNGNVELQPRSENGVDPIYRI